MRLLPLRTRTELLGGRFHKRDRILFTTKNDTLSRENAYLQCFEVILISKQLLGKPSGKFIIQAVANRKLLGGATYVDNRYAL